MEIKAKTIEGYRLLHEGAIALAEMEANGIRVDVARLQVVEEELGKEVERTKELFKESSLWKCWRERFGDKAVIGSREQLVRVLEEMGYEIESRTATGRAGADEETLSNLGCQDLKYWLAWMKLEKLRGTFVKGIRKELCGDRIHPWFHLHTARTYRSSSSDPNFQNFPARDQGLSSIVRSLFIPSDGRVLVETDFKGIEVSVSACYHKDPNFISFLSTPGKDMHRDVAAQLFLVKEEEVTKELRYLAKNRFVFPQFYGDFYVSCARSIWSYIEKQGLSLSGGGVSVLEHLKSKGISKLGLCDPNKTPVPGSFESHVKQVEEDFWDRRFPRYKAWRKTWYELYLDRGYFDILTGFRVHGVFGRNAVVNYPIQGTAFHCLLQTLIGVLQKIREMDMASSLVGQIHDSLIADVPVDELGLYLSIVEKEVRDALPEKYDWLIVPLEVEHGICLPGESWYDKRTIQFRDGHFWSPDGKQIKDGRKFLSLLS